MRASQIREFDLAHELKILTVTYCKENVAMNSNFKTT